MWVSFWYFLIPFFSLICSLLISDGHGFRSDCRLSYFFLHSLRYNFFLFRWHRRASFYSRTFQLVHPPRYLEFFDYFNLFSPFFLLKRASLLFSIMSDSLWLPCTVFWKVNRPFTLVIISPASLQRPVAFLKFLANNKSSFGFHFTTGDSNFQPLFPCKITTTVVRVFGEWFPDRNLCASSSSCHPHSGYVVENEELTCPTTTHCCYHLHIHKLFNRDTAPWYRDNNMDADDASLQGKRAAITSKHRRLQCKNNHPEKKKNTIYIYIWLLLPTCCR